MGHPTFHQAPSKDLTKAQERQAQLDAQIEAFLAKGGEIKAYDTLRRPIEQGELGKFSTKPRPLAPAASPVEVPEPQHLAPQLVVEPQPAENPPLEAEPAVAEVVIAAIPAPRVKPVNTHSALKQLQREAAAIKRRLAALGSRGERV